MKKQLYMKSITIGILMMGYTLTIGQESGYLTQKLMVENDLRNRISDALSKIIDESKYVIDVSIELKITDAIEEQVTVFTGDKTTKTDVAPIVVNENIDIDEIDTSPLTPPKTSMVGLPIPGFEFEVEVDRSEDTPPVPAPEKEAPKNIEVETEAKKNPSLSKTSIMKRPSIAEVSRQEISLILNEGAAPEMIENIRQIVMMASRFNRARGDVLSIMTASFKTRRDEKTAEQVLLKVIAEKLDAMENEKIVKSTEQENWQTELDRYRDEEESRRIEDRQYLQSLLTQFEQEEKERAFKQERERIIRQDSIQINILKQQIDSLSVSLEKNLPTEVIEETQTEIQQREQLISQIDAQITDRLGSLEQVQEDLDRQLNGSNGQSSNTMTIILFLLGALLLILLLVVVALLAGRSKQTYPPPPPWMYPPRRKPKKKKKTVMKEPVKEEQTVEKQNEKPKITPAKEEDISVLQSEINDIRKAVVSMSVGQPNTATRIVQEWLEDDTPPAPAETPKEETPKKDSSDKKKK